MLDISSFQFVRDLPKQSPGSPFSTIALISKAHPFTTRTGEMLRVEFTDRTASAGTVLFSDHPQFQRLRTHAPDGPCYIRGVANTYQGNYSPRITSVDEVPADQIDSVLERVQRVSPVPVEILKERFNALLGAIQNPTVAAALKSMLAMPDIGDRFFTAPAALQVHHAYRHGLVEHTCSMGELALYALSHYGRMNLRKDVVIGGIIAHDIGKVIEYTQGVLTKVSIQGLLSSHITEGHVRWVLAAHAHGVPCDVRDAIAHVILSHHGELEHGSPVVPHLAEAWLVHKIDTLDAKMATIEGAFACEPDTMVTSRRAFLPEMIRPQAMLASPNQE